MALCVLAGWSCHQILHMLLMLNVFFFMEGITLMVCGVSVAQLQCQSIPQIPGSHLSSYREAFKRFWDLREYLSNC